MRDSMRGVDELHPLRSAELYLQNYITQDVLCASSPANRSLTMVVGIDLNKADIVGSLSPELDLLTNLASFNVNSNGFCGGVPKTFARLWLVFEINLSNNRFFDDFGGMLLKLSSLKFLNLWSTSSRTSCRRRSSTRTTTQFSSTTTDFGSVCRLTWRHSSKMVLIDRYIFGGFVASLFGFVLLYNLRRNVRKTKGPKGVPADVGFARSADGGFREDAGGGDADVIIVGAGVAGAALACTLGKDGRRVHVIERDLTEPDRIVGELLQPGGYLKLIELGLEDCLGDIDAQRVFGYALYKDGKSTKLSYPLEKFHSDVSGRSFHNGRFIQRMREKAKTIPNVRLEQGTVTSLLEEKGTVKGVQYKTKNGEVISTYAPLTIVCDGCFSNLRRSLCTPQVDIPSCFVGLVLENCELPFANHGHVILADPSPILFYPISSTEIRCLVDVPGQKVPSIANGEMANYLKTIVAPQVPPELHNAFIAAIEKGNIKTMPNRSMPANPQPTPGAILMGDAFNMRHPLTGGGMTVALSDIVILRDLLRPLPDINDASTLCKYLESFYTLRKGASGIIFPIIKAEGVRQMFFPATLPAYYRAPPV
ncbi:squalene monooxygenase [Striga asiatica]|uniref:Squalene monooxygenase n=1 Tax=Striga asiatica TaxID=4170 RepID=A0A5A7PU76_STRAF|nr:squalene monooxygenase [Striga asiatica]